MEQASVFGLTKLLKQDSLQGNTKLSKGMAVTMGNGQNFKASQRNGNDLQHSVNTTNQKITLRGGD